MAARLFVLAGNVARMYIALTPEPPALKVAVMKLRQVVRIVFPLAFFATAWLGAAPKCLADSFFEYTVSNMTFVGNNACGPSGTGVGHSPCVETFNLSLELDEAAPTFFVVPGSASATFTGPLSGWSCCGDSLALANFVALFAPAPVNFSPVPVNTNTDEVDIGTAQLLLTPIEPGTFAGVGTMFSCQSQTCVKDFYSSTSQQDNDVLNGSGTITISAIPEPATGWLLGAGLIALLLVLRRNTSSRTVASK